MYPDNVPNCRRDKEMNKKRDPSLSELIFFVPKAFKARFYFQKAALKDTEHSQTSEDRHPRNKNPRHSAPIFPFQQYLSTPVYNTHPPINLDQHTVLRYLHYQDPLSTHSLGTNHLQPPCASACTSTACP